jgi:hypothetical protein
VRKEQRDYFSKVQELHGVQDKPQYNEDNEDQMLKQEEE